MKGLGSLHTPGAKVQRGGEGQDGGAGRAGCLGLCWSVTAGVTGWQAPSHGGGREEERSCFVIRREMSATLEISSFLASGSFGTELGGGGRGKAGFLQSEPFPICSTGPAGVRGGGSPPAHWSLGQWGDAVLTGTSLCTEGPGCWGGGGRRGRGGRGKHHL